MNVAVLLTDWNKIIKLPLILLIPLGMACRSTHKKPSKNKAKNKKQNKTIRIRIITIINYVHHRYVRTIFNHKLFA